MTQDHPNPDRDPDPQADSDSGSGPERGAGRIRGGRLSIAVREFLDTESASAVLLAGAAVVALAWANSPWPGGYESFWHRPLEWSVGSQSLTTTPQHIVNDALMTFFFLVVGLEIKRELVVGELHDPRAAMLPALAAVGGMVVPAAIFVACNAATGTAHGWGIPMATDIAFALALVGYFGRGLAPGLRLFLLTLAIVDDVGGIVVIAGVYSTGIRVAGLALAAVALGAIVVLRLARVERIGWYLLPGVALWAAVAWSGVHATIAGVVLGLLTPARPLPGRVTSPVEQLEHRLHPPTSFVIVPLFALANAGVRFEGAAFSHADRRAIVLGIVAGLMAGKTLGISLFTWLAVRFRLASLPNGVRWSHVVAVATSAGIGFTVSLLIADLAYRGDRGLVDAAKTGVLLASVLAAGLGALLLRRAARFQADRASISP
ncbi:MAG: Na+/H+ antiporter NhaA [Acidimicrobiia bacterium]